MFKRKQTKRFLALSIVISVFALAMLSPALLVKAQGTATVTIATTAGGTTDPTGTKTYNDGDTVTLTATADTNYVFTNWLVNNGTATDTLTDNPASFTAVGGLTYSVQPVFSLLLPPPGGSLPSSLANAAIVVLVASAGGTTVPPPGTYAFTDATDFNIIAMPLQGYAFVHWVISGTMMSHGSYPFNPTPTDNPYNVNHGYGQTYTYQAVFTPTGVTEPTPAGATPTATPTATPILAGLTMEWLLIIVLVVVIVVILVAFGLYARRHK